MLNRTLIKVYSHINSVFVVAKYSSAFHVERAAEVAVSIVKLSHDFNLIFSRLNVIYIDRFVTSLDVALANSTAKGVSPVAATQMPHDFPISVDSFKAPHWQLLLQRQKHQALVDSVILLADHCSFAFVVADLAARETQICFDWRVI